MTQFSNDSVDDSASSSPVSWPVQLARLAALLLGLAVLYHFKPALVYAGGVFVITLSVLVFVHEWGHFQFARWAGMKVNRFAIGFPPFIYTKRVKGIDYSIGALPIGGMVDIAGLGSEEEMVATTKNAVASNGIATAATTIEGVNKESSTEARADNYLSQQPRNPNAPHGEKLFQDSSLGWRFMTLFAGPMMNFLYALVVFIGVYAFIGLPNPILSGAVESVSSDTPAAKADVRAGDKIIGVDKLRSHNPQDISKAVRDKKGAPIVLWLDRQGVTLQKTITPVLQDVDGDGQKVPFLGLQFDQDPVSITYEKTDVVTAAKSGFYQSVGISLQILDTLKRALTRQLSKEEVKGIGGPVKIAQATGDIAQKGFVASLLFSAMLSVNLGLMNLLPFPALDGGRILFLGYELIARKPIDARKEGIAHTVGMVMLLAFMLFITARDILPLITKHLS